MKKLEKALDKKYIGIVVSTNLHDTILAFWGSGEIVQGGAGFRQKRRRFLTIACPEGWNKDSYNLGSGNLRSRNFWFQGAGKGRSARPQRV